MAARKPDLIPKETKKEKFTRLANKRVNTALAKIRLIGNLGGSQYESTQEQRKTIVIALLAEVKTVEDSLSKTKSESTLFEI